jgi:hypothetical protein
MIRPAVLRCLWISALAATAATTEAQDQDTEPGRLYRTREEQREAGLERRLTPWLSAGGLLEFEWEQKRSSSAGAADRKRDHGITAQLGLQVTPGNGITAEAIFEYDTSTGDLRTDEGTVGIERDPWELVLGRQYLPFGEFYSHFATGPLIEFGETRATAGELSFDISKRLTLSVSGYHGAAFAESADSRGVDWVLAMEARPADALLIGASYITDLADSDERPLEEAGNRYARKVPGLSGYLFWAAEDYEISLEALGATRAFAELEADRNHPVAWNFEFAYFLKSGIELAARAEGSHELEDAPRRQYGAAVTFRPHVRVAVTLEYLYGHFQGELATDEDDNPYDHVNQFGVQISVLF